MKCYKLKFFIGLLVLVCVGLTTCKNSIMKKWWEQEEKTEQKSPVEISTDTFAVVVFDSNGGSPQPKAVKISYDLPAGRMLPMTRSTDGFLGWFDERGNLWDVEKQPVTKDDVNSDGILLLTARWETTPAAIVIVTFDITGSHPEATLIPDQYIARGGKIVQPVVPKAPDGVGFAGWLYDGNQWDFNNTVTSSITSPMTLVAKWDHPYRVVRFVPNGGTRPDGFTTLTHEFAISLSYGIVPDPGPLVRDGYSFGGWYEDTSYIGDPWDFVNGRVTEEGPALILFAKWIPLYRTIIFDQTGGSGVSPNEFIYLIGSRVVNPGGPVKPGNLFLGWSFDPTGAPGSPVDFTRYEVPEPESITENDPIYIYARWMTTQLYVTFNIVNTGVGGGTGKQDEQYVNYGERILAPRIITPPAGYYVDGWYTDQALTKKWDFDDRITTATNLYADYKPGNWTVIFDLGNPPGGTVGFEKPEDQHIPAFGKVTEPFMPGVAGNRDSFYCWSTSPNTTGNYVNISDVTPYDFDTQVTGDFTLYARWAEPIPDLVWVPKGSFVMGDSGISGSPAALHAYPTRRVTLDGFYISRFEITQEDGSPLSQSGTGYNQIMAGIISKPPSQFTGTRTRPVENVSWYDAIEYCNTRSDNEHLNRVYTITNRTPSTGYPTTYAEVTADFSKNGYRLPTEAEWEYAARGGYNPPQGLYPYAGSDNADSVAWYNATVKGEPAGFQTTQTVGRKNANSLGIYDMSGNLSEWCYDWFAPYNTLQNPGINGTGPNPIGPASGTEKVRRGGAWNNAAGNIRIAVRNSEAPSAAHWAVGFRVVRGPAGIW